MNHKCGGRSLREAWVHGKSHVCRNQELANRLREHARQALAAEFGGRRSADPAALGQALVRILESRGRGNAAVIVALAAFLVADAIERRQNVLAEFCGFREHRFEQIGRGVGKARQIVVAIDVKYVGQQEHHVINGSLISRHNLALRIASPGANRPGRYNLAHLRQRWDSRASGRELVLAGQCFAAHRQETRVF